MGGIALALCRDHMHQNRTTLTVGRLKSAHHLTDVVTVDRTHVSETEFLEHGTNLGNSESSHASLQAIEFRRKLSTHERQVTNTLFDTSRDELHRWAKPRTVQNTR